MKQIAWIISPPAKGSGGFRTICSKASFLDSRGYENYFYIMPGCEAYKSAHRVQTEIKDWFGYSPKEVLVAPSVPEDFCSNRHRLEYGVLCIYAEVHP